MDAQYKEIKVRLYFSSEDETQMSIYESLMNCTPRSRCIQIKKALEAYYSGSEQIAEASSEHGTLKDMMGEIIKLKDEIQKLTAGLHSEAMSVMPFPTDNPEEAATGTDVPDEVLQFMKNLGA